MLKDPELGQARAPGALGFAAPRSRSAGRSADTRQQAGVNTRSFEAPSESRQQDLPDALPPDEARFP